MKAVVGNGSGGGNGRDEAGGTAERRGVARQPLGANYGDVVVQVHASDSPGMSCRGPRRGSTA